MTPIPEIRSVFRCPVCRERLDWTRQCCSRCGSEFSAKENILDFLPMMEINLQHEKQIAIHQQLDRQSRSRQSSKYARIYSRYWNIQYLRHLKQNRLMILDAGCGTGGLTRDLSAYGKTVGLDISRDMIRAARDMTPPEKNIVWTVCTGETLPFSQAGFDVVCFRGALHHMSDETAGIAEAFRVLKPGGLLMLSEPNDDSILLRIPRKIVRRKMNRFGADHKAFDTFKLTEMIEKAGFRVIFTKYFSFLTQPFWGMEEIAPFFRYLPFSPAAAKWLVHFDEMCSKLPVVKRQSFDVFVAAAKK